MKINKKAKGTVEIFEYELENDRPPAKEIALASEDCAWYYYELGYKTVTIATWLEGGKIYVKVQY